MMNILLICSQLPYPPITGSRQRYFNLIKFLSRHHKIYLLSIIRSPRERKYIRYIQQYCRSIDTVLLEKTINLKTVFSLIRRLGRGLPLYNALLVSDEMTGIIQRLTQSISMDVVQIEHSFMGHFIHALPKEYQGIKILVYLNIEYIQNKRTFRLEKSPALKIGRFINWITMRHWEAKFGSHFDMCITVSHHDMNILKTDNPLLPLICIPNGTDTTAISPLPLDDQATNIIFVGSFGYTPNVDGIIYFYNKIFPIIRHTLPETVLYIVGANPPPKIVELAKDRNVRVTGYLEDLDSCYRRAGVAVAPLRAGSGTRLKILEAMAYGRPVVSTTIGCEGLDVTHGKNILIADSSDAFASYCIKALSDITLKHLIAVNARRIVEDKYSWESIARNFHILYTDLANKKNKNC